MRRPTCADFWDDGLMYAEFAAALLDPAAPCPAGIAIRGGADPAHRFGIYRNNVIVALIDALADSYPIVGALVGVEFFRAMAREFSRQHPPRSPVMAEYGGDFATFIDGFQPAGSLPYLGDMARLEWQRVVAWHAADAVPLAAEDVAHLVDDPAALMRTRWQLHTSLAVVSSPFAIVSLWTAHQLESADAIEEALAGIDWGQAESALVLRQGLRVMILNLTPAEAVFINALHTRCTLADAVLAAQCASPQFDLTLMFSLLLRSGALLAYS